MKTEEDKKESSENTIKSSIEVIKEKIPKIIEKAKELKFKTIVKNAESLDKYIVKT